MKRGRPKGRSSDNRSFGPLGDLIRKNRLDKGYGLKRLSAESGVPLDGMLFIGDAIFPGGNDYPAAEIGLDTVRVRDVAETTAVVTAIIACLHR